VTDPPIEELLRQLAPEVLGALMRRYGRLDAAEDAVQEALLRSWERSEKGQEIDSLEAWVTTVAMNLSRSGLRRLRSERRVRSRLAAPRNLEPDAERLDVERALSTLPRRQREAVVLRYYLQLDTREIAGALGINEGTVKSTLFRARAALTSALELDQDEEANDRGA
jgi:RNA polymerase sigma-70 factor, ECF subfamily